MTVYPKDTADLIQDTRFSGAVENATGIATEARVDCGCFIAFEMRIDHPTSTINDIRYRTNGCGFMVAAAERLAGLLYGEALTDLEGSFDPEIMVVADREVCVAATVKALQAAFADHRLRVIDEFRGEKALVCTCFGVSEEQLEEFVRMTHPETIDQVVSELRAGSGCGSCRMLIQDIIEST